MPDQSPSVSQKPASVRYGSTVPAGRKNMLLLIQLRWIAVFGQVLTIILAQYWMGINLPLARLCMAPALLVVFNIASFIFLRHRTNISNEKIFTAMMVDIAALTWQLYLTGGITNPFISLFLLQVVLGSVLLGARSPWLLTGITIFCFALLSVVYIPWIWRRTDSTAFLRFTCAEALFVLC